MTLSNTVDFVTSLISFGCTNVDFVGDQWISWISLFRQWISWKQVDFVDFVDFAF